MGFLRALWVACTVIGASHPPVEAALQSSEGVPLWQAILVALWVLLGAVAMHQWEE
jgi:hypothetical protein